MPKRKPKPSQAKHGHWYGAQLKLEEQLSKPIHVHGVTFAQQLINCGKDRCRKGCASGRASHGPYWYAYGWSRKTGKERSLYIGKELPSVDKLEQIAEDLGATK